MNIVALCDMQFIAADGKSIEVMAQGTTATVLTPNDVVRLKADDRLAWTGGTVRHWGSSLQLDRDKTSKRVKSPQMREDMRAAREGRKPNQVVPFMWNNRFRYADVGVDVAYYKNKEELNDPDFYVRNRINGENSKNLSTLAPVIVDEDQDYSAFTQELEEDE